MKTRKLTKLLETIKNNLETENISYAVIGALALGVYGLPRYTCDIDLMAELRYSDKIESLLIRLGYTCFQKTSMFAQFDSEMGVLGRVDLMFVETQEGKDMLNRRIYMKDDVLGKTPVIQPTDYMILKLMAIANNPARTGNDEGDITNLLKISREGGLPDDFEPLDQDRLVHFAEKFRQTERIMKLLSACENVEHPKGGFSL